MVLPKVLSILLPGSALALREFGLPEPPARFVDHEVESRPFFWDDTTCHRTPPKTHFILLDSIDQACNINIFSDDSCTSLLGPVTPEYASSAPAGSYMITFIEDCEFSNSPEIGSWRAACSSMELIKRNPDFPSLRRNDRVDKRQDDAGVNTNGPSDNDTNAVASSVASAITSGASAMASAMSSVDSMASAAASSTMASLLASAASSSWCSTSDCITSSSWLAASTPAATIGGGNMTVSTGTPTMSRTATSIADGGNGLATGGAARGATFGHVGAGVMLELLAGAFALAGAWMF